jgi:hypothetical protein
MLDFSKRKTCVGQNYQALGIKRIISFLLYCRKLSAGSFLSGLQRIYIGSNQIEEIAPNTFHHPPSPLSDRTGKTSLARPKPLVAASFCRIRDRLAGLEAGPTFWFLKL